MYCMLLVICVIICLVQAVSSANYGARHFHEGILKQYSGELISYSLTREQELRLDLGEPVLVQEVDGKAGAGFVIHDIHATPQACMQLLRNFTGYVGRVPKIKHVAVTDVTWDNGVEVSRVDITAGYGFFSLQYFLVVSYLPDKSTMTWRLDYAKQSDIDDSVGHWQIMPHPSKSGCTRILFSTNVILFSWVPQFIIAIITSSALVESTAWIKLISEKFEEKTRLIDTAELHSVRYCNCYRYNESADDATYFQFTAQC